MTTTTSALSTPTGKMTERELSHLLFEYDIQIDRMLPIYALATTKEVMDDDELKAISGLGSAISAMRLATPVRYLDDDDKVQERPATDEDAEDLRIAFCRSLWAAGGDPLGYDRANDDGAPEDDEGDDDDRQSSFAREMACENLKYLLGGCTGWVVEITTPVRKIRNGMRGFTWGYTTSAWFWGPTPYEALDAVFAWDELQWSEDE